MKNKNFKSKIENQDGEYIGYFPIEELNTILTGKKLTEKVRTVHNFSLKLNILNGNLERDFYFKSRVFNQNYL